MSRSRPHCSVHHTKHRLEVREISLLQFHVEAKDILFGMHVSLVQFERGTGCPLCFDFRGGWCGEQHSFPAQWQECYDNWQLTDGWWGISRFLKWNLHFTPGLIFKLVLHTCKWDRKQWQRPGVAGQEGQQGWNLYEKWGKKLPLEGCYIIKLTYAVMENVYCTK